MPSCSASFLTASFCFVSTACFAASLAAAFSVAFWAASSIALKSFFKLAVLLPAAAPV